MLPEGVPLVRLEDGRPFGADLPMAVPGVAKRGQGWPKATAGGGASVASGLEGASWPVVCGQVRAVGPLGIGEVSPAGWPYARLGRVYYRLGFIGLYIGLSHKLTVVWRRQSHKLTAGAPTN